MDCEFSEFSFGYAITEALSRRGLAGSEPPEFPSTIEEAKPGGGFDVRLGVVFLQFKRPVALIGPRSTSCGTLRPPFFRFRLRSREKWLQHRLLIALERANTEGFVRYCAPRFWTQEDFALAYQQAEVVERSVFIPPSWGPVPTDDEPHVFAYGKTDESPSYFCSEPRPPLGSVGGKIFLDQLSATRQPRETPQMPDVRALLRQMETIIEHELPQARETFGRTDQQSIRSVVARIRDLAAAYFDCASLFVAGGQTGR